MNFFHEPLVPVPLESKLDTVFGKDFILHLLVVGVQKALEYLEGESVDFLVSW